MINNNSIEEMEFPDISEWEDWLSKNYLSENSIWIVFYKKGRVKYNFTHEQALEVALSYGWIDGNPKKRDDESYLILFSKRNPKSNWSSKNKSIIRKLIKNGRISEYALNLIENAKKNGTWDALDEVQQNIVPEDLQNELSLNSTAEANFNKLPPSSKRIILEWILNAKTLLTQSGLSTSRQIAATTILAQRETGKIKSVKNGKF